MSRLALVIHTDDLLQISGAIYRSVAVLPLRRLCLERISARLVIIVLVLDLLLIGHLVHVLLLSSVRFAPRLVGSGASDGDQLGGLLVGDQALIESSSVVLFKLGV